MEVDILKLIDRYNDGESINQIAKSVGWWPGTTRARLKKAGCKFRTVSEGVHLAKRAKPFAETESVIELIDGLLLGDGSIERRIVGSRLSLTQSINHSEWIDYVANSFDKMNIEYGFYCKPEGVIFINGKKYKRQPTKTIRTRSYTLLTRQRNRWYTGNTKIIPKDVRLTPTSIAQWYAGDGGIGGGGYHAFLCTECFSIYENNFLISKLKKKYDLDLIIDGRNRIIFTKK